MLYSVVALVFGALLGALGWEYVVVAPARDAILLGLREEMSLAEQASIASFRNLRAPGSIAAQKYFIEFAANRTKLSWIEKRDGERAIGMAKIRMAIDQAILGRNDLQESLLQEAGKHLRAAGVSADALELADALRRDKEKFPSK